LIENLDDSEKAVSPQVLKVSLNKTYSIVHVLSGFSSIFLKTQQHTIFRAFFENKTGEQNTFCLWPKQWQNQLQKQEVAKTKSGNISSIFS
jgi:hypothetical protein